MVVVFVVLNGITELYHGRHEYLFADLQECPWAKVKIEESSCNAEIKVWPIFMCCAFVTYLDFFFLP